MATPGPSSSRADPHEEGREPEASHEELPPLEHPTTILLKSKEQLQGLLSDLQIATEANQRNLTDENDVEKIMESLQVSQKELFSLTTNLSQQELLIKRLQLSHTLIEEIFPPDGVPDNDNQPIRQHLKNLLGQQCELVSQVLGEHKETEELRSELEKIQQNNFEYTVENRRLMSKLKERQEIQSNKAKQFSENAEVEMAREKVQKLIWRAELQRNTLQGLVIGSGVNWAQDEELTEMVLGLGRPLDV